MAENELKQSRRADERKNEMSDSNSNSRGGGTGFFGLLTVLFIGLKLTGYIAWSWFWVLSPLLGPMVIIMTAVGLYGIVCAIEEATKK